MLPELFRSLLQIADHLLQYGDEFAELLQLFFGECGNCLRPRFHAPMSAYDLWMAAFRDSEGNIMQLMSEVPH